MTTTVTQLWRFPVKSMGGHVVDEVRVDRRGVHADRLWAVRDLDHDITATARKIPALLGCTARYASEPGPDAGPGNVPPVIVTFPDGTEVASGDPSVHAKLSELVGRPVRLTALPPASDTSQHKLSPKQTKASFSAAEVRRDFGLTPTDALPDTSVFTTKQVLTLARYSTPPGTFVDLSPVHLLSTTSLASLSADGDGYDVRRFRPNVLVQIDDPASEFPESAWVTATLEIGTATMRVTVPTIRCVVPTRPQPGLELDRALTRRLAERTDRFLGVYADVVRPGVLRVGDELRVVPASPPGVARRTAAAAGRAVMRQGQRLLEATVLRERD
ncbi:MAG: MOSC N-terminal beta barrel domain-containing protein [Mycobacterium sp.]